MDMRFVVIGDLHGQMPNVYYGNLDLLLSVGDFCANISNLREMMFKEISEKMKNPKITTHWYDMMGRSNARKALQQLFSEGRKALEKLNSFGLPAYVVPGNWDQTPEDSQWAYLKSDHFRGLTKGLKNIINVHEKRVDIGEYQLIGYGVSSGPEIPRHKEDLAVISKKALAKRKQYYKTEYAKLSRLFDGATKPVLFLTHNVPFGTSIDQINNKDSPRNGYHYGSLIVRDLVEKYKPVLAIGGHMHEHFASAHLGKTTCINAGFGGMRNVLVELYGEKVLNTEFYEKP